MTDDELGAIAAGAEALRLIAVLGPAGALREWNENETREAKLAAITLEGIIVDHGRADLLTTKGG